MEIPKDKFLQPNPVEEANVISKLLFWYSIPLFRKSLKSDMSTSDLYRPLKEHQAEYLGSQLYKTWEVKVEQHNKVKITNKKDISSSKYGLLLRCILKVFGIQILSLGLCLFGLDILFKFTQPIFLGLLVSHYASSEKDAAMYYYAAAVILCSVFNVLFSHSYLLKQFHCGMKVRIALMGTVYRKLLRLSKGALRRTTSGTVVNLLTSDVAKIDSSLFGLHQLWLGPLETLIVFVLVYYQIGFSAVAGLAVLILLVPVQVFIGKSMAKLRRKIADHSDVRIRLMKEIVRGAHVIKMYVWEKPFGRLIASARKREMNVIRRSNFLRAFNLSCMMFTSRIAIFTSLVMYALLGQIVTAEKAFVITAYYNILRQIMMVSFPRGIEQLGETFTSLERVQNFMLLEEKDKVSINQFNNVLENESSSTTPLLSSNVRDYNTNPSLKLMNVKAKWDQQDEYLFDEVSLNIECGEHVAIIGHVGCGKSSILQAILGEMQLTSGQIDISNGTLSYAPQEPWIFNGSIQRNILFNQELDTSRYEQVIKACALNDDLKSLPNGDMTVVGDHGQTLSGGQKARIGLARAIYRKANIYLLDDPLSAVDIQVAKHLIEHCIHGFLQGSIVLLASHQVQLLGQMDQIVFLEKGKVRIVNNSNQPYSELPELEDLVGKLQTGTNKAAVHITNKQPVKPFINGNMRSQNPQSNQESRPKNAVGVRLYLKYIQLGGGYTLFIVAMLLCAGTQLFASGSDYFLAYWVNTEANHTYNLSEGYSYSKQTLNSTDDTQNDQGNISEEQLWLINLFTFLTAGSIFVTLVRTGLLFEIATKASKNLHNIMYEGIINAHMHFFQTNPAGRIINRVSKDMNLVDDVMPQVIIEVIQIALAFLGVILIVAVVNPWSLLPTVVMAVLFVYMRKVYLATARNLMRMQGIARSPVYSHVIESLAGISTIQALCVEDHLTRVFDHHQDKHSSIFYASLTTGRAFAFSLDAICILYIMIVVLSSLERCNAGELGLAITQAVGVTGMLQWGVRQSSEMENLMTSVERIVEYANIKIEKSDDISSYTLRPDWPEEGKLKFDKVSLWYSPDKGMKSILNGVSFEIDAMEKVGIVGRTGSGKSSLVNALFRLAFTEGSIQIDNENINQIPLDRLRRHISVIPQEPILFSGSVRYNLDPFHVYSDEEIWCALESVQLRELVQGKPMGLDNEISEEGGGLSTGEKQLLCLARAILRKSKILIMDEATANVDRTTDWLIQKTIRDKFKDSTVLVIAHRLDTVMDLNRVGIMDNGNLVEYGRPFELLKSPHSKLFDMAHEAGESNYMRLLDIARQSNDIKVVLRE